MNTWLFRHLGSGELLEASDTQLPIDNNGNGKYKAIGS